MIRPATLAGVFALAASTFTLIAAPVAGATTYNNDTPIIIPNGGAANPYPSSITVSGTAGPITDVNVGLDGFSHGVPTDVSMVLVAPSGQALMVVDCVGSSIANAGAFITLDDLALADLPSDGVVRTGAFRPTAHCGTRLVPVDGGSLAYENPGPGMGGTATFASAFNGLSAIGTWKLYVIDYFVNDGGSIPGGWSLDVKPDVTPLPAVTPISTPAAPGLTCGTGTVQQGSQCVVKKKKKKNKNKRRKK